jgi:hypothetical protein
VTHLCVCNVQEPHRVTILERFLQWSVVLCEITFPANNFMTVNSGLWYNFMLYKQSSGTMGRKITNNIFKFMQSIPVVGLLAARYIFIIWPHFHKHSAHISLPNTASKVTDYICIIFVNFHFLEEFFKPNTTEIKMDLFLLCYVKLISAEYKQNCWQ